MANEEDDNAYSWEAGYAEGLNIREVLREDESGSLQPAISDLLSQAKRKRRLLERPARVRLGIMRHVFVLLDCSACMTEKDLMPSRISCVRKSLDGFLDKFFEQNPISQVGIILLKDKRAEKLTDLTGNHRKHREALAGVTEASCAGEFSLQNALEMAMKTLKDLPSHASREIIVIMGSLSTCDPSNISTTFELLKRHKVRCSVIGLTAEVYVCKRLCDETGGWLLLASEFGRANVDPFFSGVYNIILDDSHLDNLLFVQTAPPIAAIDHDSNLVKMGFPVHKSTGADRPSICVCHADDKSMPQPTTSGYFCPQCGAKYCNVPIECRLCHLTLVSAPQLARAYQHLVPLPTFEEIDATPESQCHGCCKRAELKAYRCNTCRNEFCIDCDLLLHESLQTCPGCNT